MRTVAEELAKVSRDLVAANGLNPKGLRDGVVKWVNKKPVYVVIDVTFTNDGKASVGRVSGNILRLGAWLQAGRKSGTIDSYKIVDFTTDRNEAIRKADEV